MEYSPPVTQTSLIVCFPLELKLLIAGYCQPSAYLNLRRTCRRMHADLEIDNKTTWNSILNRHIKKIIYLSNAHPDHVPFDHAKRFLSGATGGCMSCFRIGFTSNLDWGVSTKDYTALCIDCFHVMYWDHDDFVAANPSISIPSDAMRVVDVQYKWMSRLPFRFCKVHAGSLFRHLENTLSHDDYQSIKIVSPTEYTASLLLPRTKDISKSQYIEQASGILAQFHTVYQNVFREYHTLFRVPEIRQPLQEWLWALAHAPDPDPDVIIKHLADIIYSPLPSMGATLSVLRAQLKPVFGDLFFLPLLYPDYVFNIEMVEQLGGLGRSTMDFLVRSLEDPEGAKYDGAPMLAKLMVDRFLQSRRRYLPDKDESMMSLQTLCLFCLQSPSCSLSKRDVEKRIRNGKVWHGGSASDVHGRISLFQKLFRSKDEEKQGVGKEKSELPLEDRKYTPKELVWHLSKKHPDKLGDNKVWPYDWCITSNDEYWGH